MQKNPQKDPVCGMSVATDSAQTAEFAGTRYYFCSAPCVKKFNVAPSHYLSPVTQTATSAGHSAVRSAVRSAVDSAVTTKADAANSAAVKPVPQKTSKHGMALQD